MTSSVFREYDIRGLTGSELTEDFYHRLGLALGTTYAVHGDESVVVGRDMRATSPAYARALRRGLVETGRRVLDIGEVTTPMTVFALNFLGTDGSVAVTASHNPAEYNGAKIRRKMPLFGEELQRLRATFEKGAFMRGEGSEEAVDVREAYLTALAARMRPKRALKVVVDAGNGCGGLVGPDLLERLGFEVVQLYCDPDGSFPNHHPDPTVPKNLEDLRKAVLDERADAGVAWDGDADRVVLVDDQATIHWPDRLLMALAPAAIRKHPGGVVVYDVKCSQGVEQVVTAAGGRARMVKTGYPHILAGMRDPDAVLGGEFSGHVYFGGDALVNFDDGVHAAARVLTHFADDSRPVSVQMAELPRSVMTPEIRADVPEERKFAIVDKLLADFRADREVVKLIDVDGARVVYPEGWGLVRASNTQPSLVLVFEARDEAGLSALKRRFAAKLAPYPEVKHPLA
jgi:phosphomannomutase/phosphoglucomutase